MLEPAQRGAAAHARPAGRWRWGCGPASLQLLPVSRLRGWSGASVEDARPRPRPGERARRCPPGPAAGQRQAGAAGVRCRRPDRSRSARSGDGDGGPTPGDATRPRCSPTPRSATLPSVDVPQGHRLRAVAGAGRPPADRAGLVPAARELVGPAGPAMHEVAESTTVTWAPVRDSLVLVRPGRTRGHAGHPARGAAARARPVDAASRSRVTALGFGRWHGDWAPWNMGSRRRAPRALGLGAVVDRRPARASTPSTSCSSDCSATGLPSETALAALLAETPRVLDRWYADPEQVRATVLALRRRDPAPLRRAGRPEPETAQLTSPARRSCSTCAERLGRAAAASSGWSTS